MLTDRESMIMTRTHPKTVVVLGLSRGSRVILRESFQPPTLRMLAAQAAFKIDPAISAIEESEFVQATGVDLNGHFE